MSNPIRDRRVILPWKPPGVAARFVSAGASSASIADNASLSGGAGVRQTIAAWVWLDILDARYYISKSNPAGTFEYHFDNTGTQFRYRVSQTGAAVTASVTASSFGTPALFAWNYVVCRYDGVNISICVNAGTVNTTAYSSDIFDGANDFRLGSDAIGGSRMTGRLDRVAYWSRAITDAEVSSLYLTGVGKRYRDLDSGLKTGLVSWWDLDGNLFDAHGTNHLTNNSVLFASGLP